MKIATNNYSTAVPVMHDPFTKKVLDVSRSNWLFKSLYMPKLQKEITAIAPQQLHTVLKEISEEKDGKEILDGLTQILSIDRLQEAFALDSAEAVKDIKQEAVQYLNQVKVRTPTLGTRCIALVDSLLLILESFLNAFGIAEFFKPLESNSDAKVRAQTIMMLLQFSILITTIALPLFGPQTGLIIACVLGTIWSMSLIYPHIRKMPAVLLFAENWTMQYRLGKLNVGLGRKNILDEIGRALSMGRSMKTHALLLGKSGIGKTETAKAFVAAIERGDYPHLKGKHVFYINTADFINKDEGTKVLARLNEMMGGHRDDIILVFDEIHIACQQRESFVLADQLKTLLDEGPDNFQHVIGITTEEEFYRDIYANHPAFARRFNKVYIEDTTPAETVSILQHACLKQAPEILVEPGVFEMMAKTNKETAITGSAQPAASLKLLALCLKKTTESQKSALEKQAQALRAQIAALYPQRKTKREEINALNKQLKELKGQLAKEKVDLEAFYHNREKLKELRKEMYTMAKNGEMHKQVIVLHELAIPALEKQIQNEAARLGIKTTLNAALIDEVIREEKQNIEKSKRARQTTPVEVTAPVKKKKSKG